VGDCAAVNRERRDRTGWLPGVRRIAVLRANALGDFIFALPALDALRTAYPDAEIVLLGRSWHASLLEGRPGAVDRVAVVPGDGEDDARVGGRWGDAPWLAASQTERDAFLERMRSQRFDLAVQIHGGGRNSNPFVVGIGAQTSIGLRTPDAAPLDRWVRFVYYQQEVLRCLEVVQLVGARVTALEPRVSLVERDRAEANLALAGVRRPFVVLHPGANDLRRRWPLDRFVAVARVLADEGLGVVVTGSPAESRLTAALTDAGGANAADLGGRTSLAGLTGVLARAELVVSNDSGPLHLADALGTPTVGVYWCGNLINGGPLTRGRHRPVISWRVHCPVCGVPSTEPRCEHDDSFVADVTTQEVLMAAHDLLQSATPGEERPLAGVRYATTVGR
jgi:ADP-heptose:LPS heptosyltransferase